MHRPTVHCILVVLMYAGVAAGLFPLALGRGAMDVMVLAFGSAVAVTCGLLRCLFSEGDCSDRAPVQRLP